MTVDVTDKNGKVVRVLDQQDAVRKEVPIEHLLKVLRRHERRVSLRRGVQLAFRRKHGHRAQHAQAELLGALLLLVRQGERGPFEPVGQKFAGLLVAVNAAEPFHRSTTSLLL